MIAAVPCPTPVTGNSFLSAMLGHIDCQARTLGSIGYQALAEPGSATSVALTALLTIFIALFGIRIILGHALELHEGVSSVVKIGAVLLLATSWPAYRTLVYDVVIAGPAELAGSIGRPSGIPGADGSLIERMQAVDNGLATLVGLGTGRGDPLSVTPPTTNGAQLSGVREPAIDDLAFSAGRALYLSSAVGGFGIARLGGGILLALAPLFAGLLLFTATRGIFVGWLRALFALMLAGLATTILLGIQLALIEPWLSDALARRLARVVTAQAGIELLVITLSFGIALAGSFWMIGRLAFGLQLPAIWLGQSSSTSAAVNEWRAPGASRSAAAPDTESRARAISVADALSTSVRREAMITGMAEGRSARVPGGAGMESGASQPGRTGVSHGASARRTTVRKSQGVARRDRRS